MRELLLRVWIDEGGTELVEYVLLLGLLIVGCITLFGALGFRLVDRWQRIADLL